MVRAPPPSTSTVSAASAPTAAAENRGSPVSASACANVSATRAWAIAEIPGRIAVGSSATS